MRKIGIAKEVLIQRGKFSYPLGTLNLLIQLEDC